MPNPIPKIPKYPINFRCDVCDYTTSNKKDYKKHESTIKHLTNTHPNISYLENPLKLYACICGKEYKHTSTLSAHKKKCKVLENNYIIDTGETKLINSLDDVKMLTNLIMEVVKSNSDLQKQTLEMQQQMLEVCKNSTTGGVNNSYNNNNNKTFNMQVFLNEKCKDAMNLTDFVNSMTLDFSDLEELGELGYVEGISRQMVRKLNEMDVYKRPIHCSDLKRETMYVRDNDVWEKETDTYDNLRKAIKYITKKNGDLMIPWRDAHPQCMKLEHPLNDTYLGIMNQAMGGKGEFFDSESKIIRKISKCVTIDKKDM